MEWYERGPIVKALPDERAYVRTLDPHAVNITRDRFSFYWQAPDLDNVIFSTQATTPRKQED